MQGVVYSDESWLLSLVQKEMKTGQKRREKVKVIKILKLEITVCSEHHGSGWLRLGKTSLEVKQTRN